MIEAIEAAFNVRFYESIDMPERVFQIFQSCMAALSRDETVTVLTECF